MINNFSTIFLSILLEGLPFILIGAFVSSLIQVFVSEETISRMIPKNRLLGIVGASLIGIIFPVCECAIVPIARRLIKKGVPVNMAVTFMLSVPIINPVVLGSTYYAFLGQPMMVFARAGFGVVGAIIIGCIIGVIQDGNLLKEVHSDKEHHCHKNCEHEHHHHDHNHEHEHDEENHLTEIIEHTSIELYDIGKLFIVGAGLSACLQTFVPRQYILSIGQGNVSSILVMFALAFILSICSETDAFIARTFVGQFTNGSILGFLIFGPMIDLKNTIMLSGSFKLGFVAKLIFLIFSICFILAVVSNLFPIINL